MNRRDLIRACAERVPPRVPIAKPAAKLPGDEIGKVRWRGQGRDEAAAEAATKPWWPRRKSDAPVASSGWWCWALSPARSAP